ncbi:hypothetical protein V1514DRAFT_323874 [Lipomyces japonicus]|uniref:uncharacterized protein n=1 Tax=Lipomyces japonicus TaxID=56871 RepID=UPI0034CEE2D1
MSLSLPDTAQSTELQDVSTSASVSDPQQEQEQEQPLSELITAAQQNDVHTIERLIESGSHSVHDTSPDGATALHWAAINNAVPALEFLLGHGAQVDRKGGDLQATPLHWACRVGLTYVANLLIQHGADPLRTDAQGFNALHIAVHSSSIMLIIFLLHQGMPVDFADPQGRTALHWAAYQGDALTVDTLLRWGADVKLKDATGFTALHWAVVRGNLASIKRLIEEGSDVNAETADGKTPATIAREMTCFPVWTSALAKSGRDANGNVMAKRVSQPVINMVAFLWPFVMIFVSAQILARFNFLAGMIGSLIFLWAWHSLLVKLVDFAGSGSSHLHKTPYFAGIFSASAFWVAAWWVMYVLPATYVEHTFVNILFACTFGTAMTFFIISMFMNPGFIPKPSGITEQRVVVEELIRIGQYDSRHFCIHCFTRRPLRSKHCKFCDRCVAKLDHHCPWINNCVAVRNHKPFLSYVMLLEIGIPIFLYLTFAYVTESSIVITPSCLILNDAICVPISRDPFAVIIAIWAGLQLTWISFLLMVQFWQVAKAVTTNEAYNLHNYGWMGGVGGDDEVMPSTMTDPNARDKPAAFEQHHHHHHHHKHRNVLSLCCKILGINQFVDTIKDCTSNANLSLFSGSAGGHRQQQQIQSHVAASNHYNPFDHGCINNCTDFWTSPSKTSQTSPSSSSLQLSSSTNAVSSGWAKINGTNVDYFTLWDIPPIDHDYNNHRYRHHDDDDDNDDATNTTTEYERILNDEIV